ncbi:hypothetical protein V6N11_001670 [Hibiscus sabdariffa]|uniref:Uncharacterized protein n=2 Tax=Hibiscus sabdariffa TaxID=183260 RepID=A0ABR2B724_9ROSI
MGHGMGSCAFVLAVEGKHMERMLGSKLRCWSYGLGWVPHPIATEEAWVKCITPFFKKVQQSIDGRLETANFSPHCFQPICSGQHAGFIFMMGIPSVPVGYQTSFSWRTVVFRSCFSMQRAIQRKLVA